MRILYATDGSEGALAAGRLLASLPLTSEDTVTILTVAEDEPSGATEVLEASEQILVAGAPELRMRIGRGQAATGIVRAAEEEPTDLVVLGSHGRSAVARFLLGSVAERVARHAPCSVLLVRGNGQPLRRVIVGIDGSEGAARAAGWLRGFCLPSDCEIRLVTLLANLRELAHERLIIHPPLTEESIPLDEWQRGQASARLEAEVTAFKEAGRQAVTEIRSGDPAPGLMDVAVDEGADLVVVGSHGQSAFERFLLGSVSQQVLCHAPCSVLVVRGLPGA